MRTDVIPGYEVTFYNDISLPINKLSPTYNTTYSCKMKIAELLRERLDAETKSYVVLAMQTGAADVAT